MVAGFPTLAVWNWLARDLRTAALVSKAQADLTEEDAFASIDGVSRLGNEKPKGCILMRNPSAMPTGKFVAVMPHGIPDFPWSGRHITAQYLGRAQESRVSFTLADYCDTGLQQSGYLGIFLPPFVRSSPKKAQHVFSAASYLKMSPALETKLAALCPEAPLQLLEGILRKRGIGEDAIRVGLNPSWVQGWRSHKCRKCGKPLRLIMQLPGQAIDRKVAEGVFYLFSCVRHPEIAVMEQNWY